jgi:predicted Fe-Mo cluster-binding NifX family protein
MRIVVSAQGDNLEAAASPVFGRCPTYLFVDTETLEFEAMANPAMNLGGGAGIQAAQFVVNQGAEVVLTGNLGPNAYGVLQAAGVPAYLVGEGTVGQAVEAYKAGRLQPMGGANVAGHTGMGGGRGMGMGGGRGMGMGGGRGMGMGGGRGMGMGGGRGMGMGGGRGMGTGGGRGMQTAASVRPEPEVAPEGARESEVVELRATIQELQQQLAETMKRLGDMEES